VFAVANDPVGGGFVASLARPGANVTGLSVQAPDLAGKRLEFLCEVVPGLRRLALLGNVDNPVTVREMAEVKRASHTLGIDVAALEIRSAERINTFANVARLPMMTGFRENVEAGGLMSYGPNFPDLFRTELLCLIVCDDHSLRCNKRANGNEDKPNKNQN